MSKTALRSLLVADDDDLVRAALCASLKRQGFLVHAATDGADALRKFQANRRTVSGSTGSIRAKDNRQDFFRLRQLTEAPGGPGCRN